jgi:hypothetical protein
LLSILESSLVEKEMRISSMSEQLKSAVMAREAEENLVHVSKGEGMRVVKLATGFHIFQGSERRCRRRWYLD